MFRFDPDFPAALLVPAYPLAVTLAVLSAVISAAWLIIGAEDRYWLRDFTLDCYEASE